MARVPLQIGDSGFNGDQPAHELDAGALSAVQNVRVYAGLVQRVKGHVQVFPLAATTPQALYAYSTATDRFVIHAGRATTYADDGVVRANITGTVPTSAPLGAKWTGGTLGGVFILNSPTDAPLYWGGDVAVPLAVLPGWNAANEAAVVRPFGYYLLALNVTKSGVGFTKRVMWSNATQPGSVPTSWTALPTNDAGEVDVNGDGAIVDAMVLGDQLIIYLERSMVACRYAGGQSVFEFHPLPDKVGMLATNCGADVPGVGHVVLTQSLDLVVNTGVGVKSVLEGKARQWLKSTMDPNYYGLSFVVANPKYSEVWACFPEAGMPYCTKALVWNWSSGAIGLRDLPAALCGTTAVFNFATDPIDGHPESIDSDTGPVDSTAELFAQNDTRLLIGSNANAIYAMDGGESFAGSDFTASIERTGLTLDDEETVKHLRKAWLRVDADAGTVLTVQFGAAMDAATAPTWTSAVTFTVGTSQWVDAWATGRFLAYRITSTGSARWRIRSLDLDVVTGGSY